LFRCEKKSKKGEGGLRVGGDDEKEGRQGEREEKEKVLASPPVK
jgi:hypothetical protein